MSSKKYRFTPIEEPVPVEEEPIEVFDARDHDEPRYDDPVNEQDELGDDDAGENLDEDDDGAFVEEDVLEESELLSPTTAPGKRRPPERAVGSDEFVDSKLSRKQPGDRGTFVPGWVMRACRNKPTRMLVLAQLAYWFGSPRYGDSRAKQRIAGDPHRWVLKTYSGLGREVGLSVSQVRTALADLVADGLVVRRPGVFQGRQAHYLRVSRKAVEKAAQFDE